MTTDELEQELADDLKKDARENIALEEGTDEEKRDKSMENIAHSIAKAIKNGEVSLKKATPAELNELENKDELVLWLVDGNGVLAGQPPLSVTNKDIVRWDETRWTLFASGGESPTPTIDAYTKAETDALVASSVSTESSRAQAVEASLSLAIRSIREDASGKADKVVGATNGHLAGLDSTGNLTDSGYSGSDFATAAALASEATARENADATLQGNIDAEANARESADDALGTRIDNEETAREQADGELQAQIDAISSRSDVVDVVASYAELVAYDTSTLADNDVIKVLADETHEDAIAYYRWSTTTEAWSFIGSQGPYYTISETDTLLAGKAPTNHASTATTYGVGDATKYGHVKVDSAMSSSSTNPVQNKVVKAALDEKLDKSGGKMTGPLLGYFTSSRETVIGNEYNVLLNAKNRGVTFTQSGSGKLSDSAVWNLFDGRIEPQYSGTSIDQTNPYVLEIDVASLIGNTHCQVFSAFGWTCRYWEPIRFKVELYDTYNSVNEWVTICDYSQTNFSGQYSGGSSANLFVKFGSGTQNPHTGATRGGIFRKIRITIYKGNEASNRWGISEIFFWYPEAQRVFQGIAAFSATRLETARNLKVNIASESAQSFDGSTNAESIGVTGTLPITHGGTGTTNANAAANAMINGLPLWSADVTDNTQIIRQDTSGAAQFGRVPGSAMWNYIKGKVKTWLGIGTDDVLPIAHGGTGATTAAAARTNLGLGNVENESVSNGTPDFTEASTRTNIASGEKMSTLFGKIKKWFTDLKTVAFTGSYNDLVDKPTIPTGQVQSDWNETGTSEPSFIKNKPQNLVQDASYVHTDNNYTTAEKTKLAGIEDGAQVNNIFVAVYNGNHNDAGNTPYADIYAAYQARKRLMCWNSASNARRLYTLNGFNITDNIFKFTACGGDGESILEVSFAYLEGNINNTECQAKNDLLAKRNHASSDTTYGTGTSSNYGHVKLSDSTSSTSGTSGGVAATPSAVKAAYDLANGKLDKTGDGKDVTVTFTEASTRTDVASGDTLATLFGKVKKWFSSIGSLAFKSSVADGDISGTISDAHIASASTWNDKAPKNHAYPTGKYGVGDYNNYGHVMLDDEILNYDSTEGVAATPKAVKIAYDLANGKYTKPSGGIPDSDIASASTWNNKANKDGSNATGTWPVSVSKDAAFLANNDGGNRTTGTAYWYKVAGVTKTLSSSNYASVSVEVSISDYGNNTSIGMFSFLLKDDGTDITDVVVSGMWNGAAISGVQFGWSRKNHNTADIYVKVPTYKYFQSALLGYSGYYITDVARDHYRTTSAPSYSCTLSSIGSSTRPIYLDSDGMLKQCDFIINKGSHSTVTLDFTGTLGSDADTWYLT